MQLPVTRVVQLRRRVVAVTTSTTQPGGRRAAAAARRRERQAGIVAATRELFDQRGVREAQIEDIARAVGINRAIVYRHFTGKEEIFALTLVSYLDELREALVEADHDGDDAPTRLRSIVGAFVDYGLAHPAFVDCAQDLMRQQWAELTDEISEGALYRLGRAMTGCLNILIGVLEQGTASGELHVDDPGLLANTLYASGLGTLQLARVGILVTEVSPGVPSVASVSRDQVRDYLVTSALAVAGAPRPASRTRE